MKYTRYVLALSVFSLSICLPLEAKVFSDLGKTDEKVVALTFDDGPHPKVTPKILSILKKYNVPATFFMLGECAKRYPDLVKRVVEEGHLLGNHSYNHPSFTKISRQRQQKELQATNAVLQACQSDITFFRPPYGALNQGVRDLLDEEGLDVVLWSVDSEDWRRPSQQKMLDSVLKQLHPGAIILLHDIHQGTAAVLEILILALHKKGYRCVPLTYKPCARST